VAEDQDAVGDGKVRIHADCVCGFSDRSLKLSQHREDYARGERARNVRAGISLYPELTALFGLFHVSGNRDVERSRDEKLLGLASSVAKFVSLSGIRGGVRLKRERFLDPQDEFSLFSIGSVDPLVG
jgi:hypothetical protein